MTSSVFEQFSLILEWNSKDKSGCNEIVHYLALFWVADSAGSGQCAHLLSCFMEICRNMKLPLAQERTGGTVVKISFLGVRLDNREQTFSLLEGKLHDLILWLAPFLDRRKVTLEEL